MEYYRSRFGLEAKGNWRTLLGDGVVTVEAYDAAVKEGAAA